MQPGKGKARGIVGEKGGKDGIGLDYPFLHKNEEVSCETSKKQI